MKKNGFSLIELAIVIMVIGILTATIISAKSIIDSSKIARAITLTSGSNIHSQEGLILWLETSNLTKENPKTTTMTQWRDTGPYSMVFTNSGTVSFKKSNEISAINGMYFSSSYFRVTDSFPLLSEYTSFVVSIPKSTAGYIYYLYPIRLTIAKTDSKKIVVVKNDGINKYIKLSRTHSFSQITNDDTLTTTSSTFYVGVKGYIYEIIIFDRVLSDREIGRIENYLYNKYTK